MGFAAHIHFEFEVLGILLAKENAEPKLIAWLGDPDPNVCAHALVGLARLGSEALTRLPKELLRRTEPVEHQLGSMVGVHPLGTFARIEAP